MTLPKLHSLSLLVAALSAPSMAAFAVELPNAGSLGGQLQQDQPRPGERRLPSEGEEVKPESSTATQPAEPAATIRVARVIFQGAQAMSPDSLETVVQPWLNRDVTLMDLRQMTVAIEQLYARQGFLAVRVLIPKQAMQNGALTLSVVEGRYMPPKVTTADEREQARLQRLVEQATCQAPCTDPSYVMSAEVDRALYLLNELPGISAKGTLKAGDLPGTTLLDVEVAPIKRFSGYVGANNQGNAYTGRNQISAGVGVNSLLAIGDQITLDGVTTTEALQHHTGLQQFAVGYGLPVGDYGSRVGASYSQLNYVLNGPFVPLHAEGDSKTYSAWVSHPLWLSHMGRLEARGQYDYSDFSDRYLNTLDRTRNTQTTTAGLSGYRFWDNSVAGFSLNSTVGRLHYGDPFDQWVDKQTRHSQGSFFKQRLDGYWQQTLAPQWSAYASVRTQLTNDNLDSSQSMFLGGPYGVRAFNSDSTSVDQGIQGTLELRHSPLLWNIPVTAAAFYDRAEGRVNRHGWSSNPDSDARLRMDGAGVYVKANFARQYSVGLTYAQPLSDNLTTSQHANRVWLDASMSF